MFKKLMATALLVCSVPVIASAWTFTSQVMSGGGSITANNQTQTSLNGPVSFSGYSTQTLSATATPDTGYVISKINVNGVAQPNTTPTAATVIAGLHGSAAQDVLLEVTYRVDAANVVNIASASATGNGVVTPAAANIIKGSDNKLAQPLVFQFKPTKGNKVTGVTAIAAASIVPAVASAKVNQIVTVTIPAGTLMSALSGGVVISGTFTTQAEMTEIIAYAGPQQQITSSIPVSFKLTGTSIGAAGAFSKWSSVTRPAGVAPIATTTAAYAPSVVRTITVGEASAVPTADTPAVYTFLYRIANPGNGQQVASVVSVTVGPNAVGNNCTVCHNANNIGGAGKALEVQANYLASGHKTNAHGPQSCDGCHGGAASGAHPGALACASCHGATVIHSAKVGAGATGNACGVCHTTVDGHAKKSDTVKEDGCIDCHAIGRNSGAGFVQDNSGVRAIMGEFNKRSHHITGATPTNAQCIVCHMEGKGGAYGVHTDATYHMKDNKIYLRNADTNAAIVWSGTEHTNMDNFCFSCHDSNGAAGLAASGIPGTPGFTGTATNPFGDTLTNGYDMVARTGVVDVKTAFTTTNASHHAVSGQRYKYRFSTAANAAVWVARDPAHRTMPAASEIAEGHTDFDGNVIEFDAAETMTGEFDMKKVVRNADGTTAEAGEGEATLYEAEKFVSSYIPLGAALSVADNSTLHCGDCHTVGQWKVGSSTNADGTETSVAIGAHGSKNEYLLRNSLGTDALHDNNTYVCFNCHVAGQTVGLNAGLGFGTLHPVQKKNQIMGYATTHAVSAFHIQCLADSANNTGATDRLAKSWEADKTTLDYAPLVTGGAALPPGGSDAGWGNITGIACTNCHNSGLRSSWGGIHGGNLDYTDGLGRTQKTYRFMPGMGNYRYAPPGGWDGKDMSNAPNGAPLVAVASGKPMGGCYTNSATGDTNPGFSSCSHHGTSTAVSGGYPQTYGGGTTASPTAAEPTVREATAGNALVTRPLKY